MSGAKLQREVMVTKSNHRNRGLNLKMSAAGLVALNDNAHKKGSISSLHHQVGYSTAIFQIQVAIKSVV